MNKVEMIAATASLIIISCILILIGMSTTTTMYGNVARFYAEKSINLLTSANAVNAIVWEFRGYDTLGEELVLIAASISVLALLYRERHRGKKVVENG